MQNCNQLEATQIANLLMRVRETRPLIHNITNYVVMQLTANALLAVGASPIMAHAIEEITAIVQNSGALVINIGTLDSYWLNSMTVAMRAAQVNEIPIVLDPVGVGATSFRTEATLQLLDSVGPQVIRGNAAEIMALAGENLAQSKGVDSTYQSDAAQNAALKLAQRYACVVVISGVQDLIVNQQHVMIVDNGDAMMNRVTGMGCTATALVGAFCAIEPNYFLASTAAMAVMGIAGELAQNAAGPGSFQVNFLDALFNIQELHIKKQLKLSSK